MPETQDKKLLPKHSSISSARLRNRNNNNNNNSNSFTGTRQPTDFTATQQLKLRAGDLRMARMKISLSRLRLEMEQSNKLIEQLCHETHLDLKTEKKP